MSEREGKPGEEEAMGQVHKYEWRYGPEGESVWTACGLPIERPMGPKFVRRWAGVTCAACRLHFVDHNPSRSRKAALRRASGDKEPTS